MRAALILLMLVCGGAAAQVERVYAAGPPASLLVFALAPAKLTGWTRALRPDEPLAAWYERELGDAKHYHREPSAAQLGALLGEPGVLPR